MLFLGFVVLLMPNFPLKIVLKVFQPAAETVKHRRTMTDIRWLDSRLNA